MGPRDVLDGCGKSRSHRDSIPGPNVESADINSCILLSVNFTAPIFMKLSVIEHFSVPKCVESDEGFRKKQAEFRERI